MQFFSALMGANFRGAEIRDLVAALPIGTEFTLERDPNNEYDANAIKVIYSAEDENHFVGFVAKEVAEELAPLLDGSFTATAKIIDFLGPIKPHMEIEATLADDAHEEDESSDEDNGDDEADSASAD